MVSDDPVVFVVILFSKKTPWGSSRWSTMDHSEMFKFAKKLINCPKDGFVM